MTQVALRGNPVNLSGVLPRVGSIAPDFKLTNSDLNDVALDTYSGKKKLINIIPSLDTPVCATSTRTFNEKATLLGNNAVVLVVSADLPFAQKRFCETEGLKDVIPLSTFRSDFAEDYGTLITDSVLAGLTTRAIVVLDENNKVTYTQLVNEITEEPDYDKALAALT